jgi:hypothetical protein
LWLQLRSCEQTGGEQLAHVFKARSRDTCYQILSKLWSIISLKSLFLINW